jgi:hypothetical protein
MDGEEDARLRAWGDEIRLQMSLCAAFSRNIGKMRELYGQVGSLLEELNRYEGFSRQRYRLKNQLLTTRAVLSAMLCSAERVGSHGSAWVQGTPPPDPAFLRRDRTVTVGDRSFTEAVSPLPDGELWFEKVLAGT